MKTEIKDYLRKYVLEQGVDKTLNRELTKYNEEVRAELKKIGVCPESPLVFRSSDLFGYGNEVKDLNFKNSRKNSLLKKVFYSENLKNVLDSVYPYVSFEGFEWKEIGFSPNNPNLNLTSKKLTPHRIVSQVKVSRMLFKQNETFQKQFIQTLVKSMEDKVINTVLSTSPSSIHDGYNIPEGIFSGVSVLHVNDVEQIFTYMRDLDNKNINAEWLFSGGAKTDIINLTKDYKLMDGDKLFGSPLNIEPLFGGDEDYFAYLDLSKVMIANWGYYGITIDDKTEAYKNNIIITVEGYYDFSVLDKSCIKLFHICEHGHLPENNNETPDSDGGVSGGTED